MAGGEVEDGDEMKTMDWRGCAHGEDDDNGEDDYGR